ncbi:hypothetical protein CCHR01_00023 [Colletotrichum chrysophilum]|uniref:Uncharacterized protein n=1 Tax=Colletotrichum chrysophilum TaxID=1836956 RepID=A0AAD9B0V6_9PEZI|nr:hypothetical protein CCHR01_00023 [Colletotrichum chrysophilum]
MIIRVHLKPSAGSNLEEKDVLRFQGGEDLYAFNGVDILPTTFNASRSRRPEMLGAEGYEYMLFYCSYDPNIRIKHRFACEKDIYGDVDEKILKERFRFET